jgi:FAD/FMN-containing dehydrogenase
MQGEVLLPWEDNYARARTIWNGAVDYQPMLIAQCETMSDVQMAVRAAAAHGLRLSVLGGGHDWAGRSVCHDGLMIDLSRMRQVKIEAATKVAIVGGGATAGDVIEAAAAFVRLADEMQSRIAQQILAEISPQLADYKMPERLKIVGEISRNALGKVDRKALLAAISNG